MNAPEHKVKVYIGLLGLDQHEAGALSVTRLLADAGLEVVYGGRFNVPATIAKAAVEEDVDVIGLSCHSWEYLYYIDELIEALDEAGADVPIVLGGSVITSKDEALMREKGIRRTFGPSSSFEDIVSGISELGRESRAGRRSQP